jgi:hypothetical protein
MSDNRSDDTDIESARKDMAADASEAAGSSEEQPTVEEQGVMTPDQDSVEEANASGVNPEK